MRLLFLTALVAVLLDQLSKHLVIRGMDLANRLEILVFPPFLVFRYGENRGINFGLFGGGADAVRWVLVALSLAICAVLVWWSTRAPRSTLFMVSAGLLVGGAIGNVIDRVLYGFVLDFLNTSCCGFQNPYVFNVADAFIFAGAIGIAFLDRS
jgi:signal peptidase II